LWRNVDPFFGTSPFDMDLTLTDPFRDVNRMLRRFDRESEGIFRPNLDIKESGNEMIVTAELPGVKKEDIDMNMKGNMLEIHCRRPNPCDESMMMMKGGGMEHHQGKESMEKEHEMEMGQAPERKEEESKEMQIGKTSKMGGGKMHMKCPKMRMCERFYGEMMRSFQMPDDCDMNNVKACCQDGVLKICMSKMEKHKPQKIAIE